MIVTRDEMLAIEREAFRDGGTTPETLMEEVGRRMAALVRHLTFSKEPPLVVACLGKGNNAGDALVAARHLRAAGCEVGLRLAGERSMLGELADRKLSEIGREGTIPQWSREELLVILDRRVRFGEGTLVVLDGLLGIGAKGELRDPIRQAAAEVNFLRSSRGAQVFALDIPTGVDADGGAPDPGAVKADVTLTVGFAKAGLVADCAVNHVGHLEVITLPPLVRAATRVPPRNDRGVVITHARLAGGTALREFESNKTNYGRVGVVAGGVGTTGAAAMCALGALRAGAGLVTLLVHEKIYQTAAVTAAPEVMVKPIKSFLDVLDEKFDALAVGSGLNPHEEGDELRTPMEKWPRAMVIDAGGVTALAEETSILGRAAGPRLLTPHAGEMERFWKGDSGLSRQDMKNLTRVEVARAFREAYPAGLLLKGARTIVIQRPHAEAYNSTGNPGMATGGMGDVLTGVCAALLGQGFEPHEAGERGAFLCGRAAEIAVREGQESQESLLATDLPRYFGRVFAELHRTTAD